MANRWHPDARILALAVARMADGVGNSFLIVVLPIYIASGFVHGDLFGLSITMVTGIILSLFGFFNSSLQPFTGRASDRLGRRRAFIVAGLALLLITNLSYAFADQYWEVLLVRALQGVAVAFTVPATVALVNELGTAEARGANMGTFNTFRLLGFGAGPLIGGVLVEHGPYRLALGSAAVVLDGFRATFVFASAMALLSILLVMILVRDPPRTTAHAARRIVLRVRSLDPERLLDPVFVAGIATLVIAMNIALFAPLETVVNARLHQGESFFGLQFSAYLLAQVLLQAPLGHLSDRVGRRPLILWGLLLLAPAIASMGFVTTSWEMVAARFVVGIAGAMIYSPALALAGDLARRGESGSTLAILTMGFGYGIAIGTLTAGFLVHLGFAVPFLVGAVLALVGLAIVWSQVEETAPLVVGAGASGPAEGS